MDNNMDKSLFFITLSCVCVWLIVDMALGKNYMGVFLSTIFPFMDGGGASSVGMTVEEVEEAKKNAPSSSAIGSYSVPGTTGPLDQATGKNSGTGINTVPYGAKRQE